jgi:two-component system, NarL family, response regulator LiaR
MIESNPIRVLIIDDHLMVRDGLKVFLANHPDILVAGEGENGMQAVELAARLRPHVVLMDLIMPVMDGVTATRLIRQRQPEVQVLALTSFQERHLVQDAVQAGAIGFLYKDCAPEDLVAAIRATFAGHASLSSRAAEALMHAVTHPARLGADLTPRELEVLALMARGAGNSEISRQLSLSSSTVGFHVSNVLAKLGAANRTEAVSLALKHKLVSTD